MVSHLGVGKECAYVNPFSRNINMRICKRIWGGLGGKLPQLFTFSQRRLEAQRNGVYGNHHTSETMKAEIAPFLVWVLIRCSLAI